MKHLRSSDTPYWQAGVVCTFLFLLGLVACANQSTLTIVKPPASILSLYHYSVSFHANVAYGPLPEERLDLCQPEDATSARPGILLIHGGGWMLGDKQSGTPQCKSLASLGFLVANVDYRLSHAHEPSHEWPAQLVDVQLAVRWLRAHASQLGLDSKHICADGTSAGGHLAVFLGVLGTIHAGDEAGLLANESPQVSCVVDNFGPTDLTNPQELDPLQVYIPTLFGGKTLQSDPQLYRDASPIFDVSPHSAPMLIIQGTQDSVVIPTHSLELQRALQRNHVPVQYISYDGEHSFGHVPSQQVQTIYDQEETYLVAQEHP